MPNTGEYPVVQQNGHPRKPRVLVIEDEEIVRMLIVQALGNDFEVVEAANGADALREAQPGRFDLVFQDLKLGPEGTTPHNLTGMRLVLQIHGQLGQNVPIVIVSGGDLVEASESGIFQVIPKPFTTPAIRRVAADLMALQMKTALLVSKDHRAVQPRPWWLVAMFCVMYGAAVTTGVLGLGPEAWGSLGGFALMLAFMSPAPRDAVSSFVKMLKGGKT